MKYSTHRIHPTGQIELREENGDGTFHRSMIAPNQELTKYNDIIESDPDFEKYRTQENANAYEETLVEEEPTLEEKLQQVETNRRNAYQKEADPLYLKWQRGEATEQEWLDKIAEIKERLPKPE